MAQGRKVLAIVAGTIEHEAAKAIRLDDRWFPKSAIAERFTTDHGDTALVLLPWFVKRNRWLIRTQMGEAINRGVHRGGGLIFQGNARMLSFDGPTPKRLTDDELDAAFDELIAQGVDRREARHQVHRMNG